MLFISIIGYTCRGYLIELYQTVKYVVVVLHILYKLVKCWNQWVFIISEDLRKCIVQDNNTKKFRLNYLINIIIYLPIPI